MSSVFITGVRCIVETPSPNTPPPCAVDNALTAALLGFFPTTSPGAFALAHQIHSGLLHSNPSERMAIGESFDGRVAFDRNLNGMNQYGNLNHHQGKANIVFCDGHADSLTLKIIFEDTSDEALSRWNRDHQPHRNKL